MAGVAVGIHSSQPVQVIGTPTTPTYAGQTLAWVVRARVQVPRGRETDSSALTNPSFWSDHIPCPLTFANGTFTTAPDASAQSIVLPMRKENDAKELRRRGYGGLSLTRGERVEGGALRGDALSRETLTIPVALPHACDHPRCDAQAVLQSPITFHVLNGRSLRGWVYVCKVHTPPEGWDEDWETAQRAHLRIHAALLRDGR